MNKEDVIEKLRNDEDYYGAFGKKYLSNSDIGTLLTNPLALGKPTEQRPAFLVGGYFHTAILEPDKLKKYRVIPSSTRNTKAYKEMSGGELCLLQHEVDAIELLSDTMLANDVCKGLIRDSNTEYETPAIAEIEGEMWKGKADIVNHNEKLVVDLKTTADITRFKWSASKYNYDSQAYIYRMLFGYDMLFIVIDKNTHQLGLFDCSAEFYEKGKDKVQRAVEAYKLFYKQKDFDPKQYFINKTL
jgi:hypothetical protein|tara:strand:+ start:190 stop:921 length:732 start_codon:yes stop_codon:yes gene_type:complete